MDVKQQAAESTSAAEYRHIWDDGNNRCGRATIEQAKGMLMFIYGIDADAAFDVLRVQSQQHNVKLVLIAEQIVKDMVELGRTRGSARRMAFDGFMLTAHRRITHSAERKLDGESKTGVMMKDL